MLPVPEILLNNGGESGILKEVTSKAVERRGPTRDRGGEEPAAGLEHPACLAQCARPFGCVDQMIQRA
jgi:hypothetical protein